MFLIDKKMVVDLFQSPNQHTIISLFLILSLVPISSCEDDMYYAECKKTFSCGLLRDLSYPFCGGTQPNFCGHEGFKLNCEEEDQHPVIISNSIEFRVAHVNQSLKFMTLARKDFWDNLCPATFSNTTLNDTFFNLTYDPNLQNISLFYNCTAYQTQFHQLGLQRFSCPPDGYINAFYASDAFLGETELDPTSQCSERVSVPVPSWAVDPLMTGLEGLQRVLKEGFNVSYKYEEAFSICDDCIASKGICGTNLTNSRFICLCSDQPYRHVCSNDGYSVSVNNSNVQRNVIIGVVAATGVLIICVIFYCFKRMISSITSMNLFGKITKNNQDIEAFIRSYGHLSLKRYSFSDVKKMTNLFKDKQIVQASKGHGEDFIKEVASISRTSHVNIVTLVGFCLEGHKRVLIYDFMPNGSLEKFINYENALQANRHLGWEKLHQIAIGIARGLEYLHRGCNTRIVHLDIKPHNILLDEDFCPKISDFGLAKLSNRKESILSMSEARGTIGYIAPEVFSRNFGGISHKSDVYSYGMVVLEMVGVTKKDSAKTDHSSEQYFPYWVYKRLELGFESELQGVITIQEIEIARKMTIVGLWCIQTNPSDRPSINKVIEMLEGPIEALKIPPKPFLSSHPRSPSCSSTASLT